MAFINQVLVILLAFAGVGFGFALSYIAPEEVRNGKKYFLFLDKFMLVLAFLPGLYLTFVNRYYFLLLFVVLGLAVLLAFDFPFKILVPYTWFAFLIPLTLSDLNLYILQNSLVFLYGLPAGTLLRKSVWRYKAE